MCIFFITKTVDRDSLVFSNLDIYKGYSVTFIYPIHVASKIPTICGILL